jgi:uncharacterized membrane protein YccC
MQLLLAAVAMVFVAVRVIVYASILVQDGMDALLAEWRNDTVGILITAGFAALAFLLLYWPFHMRLSKGAHSPLRGHMLRAKT